MRLKILMGLIVSFLPLATYASGFTCDVGRASSSEVSFDGTGTPSMLKIHGTSKAVPRGKLSFDASKLSGTVEFDLQTLDTGIEVRNDHMKKKYLETGKYPLAKLSLTSVALRQPFTAKTQTSVSFNGTLTLHGVSKPVHGKLSLSAANGQLTIKADFPLRIADYGIARPGYAGISMTDDVTAHADVTAPLASR